MASQVYYAGDFHYAKEATSAGESPVTHPDKWQTLAIPADLEELIVAEAAARILEGLGQPERAEQQRRVAAEERARRTIDIARRQARSRQLKVPHE